ncbi:membrane protein [Prescottella defluvii]|uniref:membrane protein n=1 Tax=Prescottella defluvii TaxID=1323361 RepID=UPI0004F2F3DD|nr:membrane protein [Prescottella defluvii]
MRTRIWAGAVLAATSIVTAASYAPAADADTPLRENVVAARAVTALTTLTADDRSPDVVPRDFDEVMGYRPTVENGMLVNPDGACSSPVPLPSEFDTACKSHDFGYDLLRYAHLGGGDLGPWARTEIDAQLDRRLHDACDARIRDRAQCFVMADTAATAVGWNSRRQGYGTPVDEPWIRYALGGSLTVAGMLASAFVIRRVRSRGAA